MYSTAAMIEDIAPSHLPVDSLNSRTFIAHSLAPGAIPTTPIELCFADATPATLVP